MSHPFQGFDAVTSKVRKRTLTKVAWSVAGYRISCTRTSCFEAVSLALLNNSVLQVISLDSNNLGLEGARAMSLPRCLWQKVFQWFSCSNCIVLTCGCFLHYVIVRSCSFPLQKSGKLKCHRTTNCFSCFPLLLFVGQSTCTCCLVSKQIQPQWPCSPYASQVAWKWADLFFLLKLFNQHKQFAFLKSIREQLPNAKDEVKLKWIHPWLVIGVYGIWYTPEISQCRILSRAELWFPS